MEPYEKMNLTMPVDGKFELIEWTNPAMLEPVISRDTMLLHHGKHLATYVNNLNALLPGTPWEGLSLEEIVCRAPEGPILNNAGQVLNHNMYFEQLQMPDWVAADSPMPPTDLFEAIKRQFGWELDEFIHQFSQAGLSLFGSGWVWLSVDSEGKLFITQEPNASNPLRRGLTPLLTIDVWEHAYYLDYQNRRADYLQKIWEALYWLKPTERYRALINA